MALLFVYLQRLLSAHRILFIFIILVAALMLSGRLGSIVLGILIVISKIPNKLRLDLVLLNRLLLAGLAGLHWQQVGRTAFALGLLLVPRVLRLGELLLRSVPCVSACCLLGPTELLLREVVLLAGLRLLLLLFGRHLGCLLRARVPLRRPCVVVGLAFASQRLRLGHVLFELVGVACFFVVGLVLRPAVVALAHRT